MPFFLVIASIMTGIAFGVAVEYPGLSCCWFSVCLMSTATLASAYRSMILTRLAAIRSRTGKVGNVPSPTAFSLFHGEFVMKRVLLTAIVLIAAVTAMLAIIAWCPAPGQAQEAKQPEAPKKVQADVAKPAASDADSGGVMPMPTVKDSDAKDGGASKNDGGTKAAWTEALLSVEPEEEGTLVIIKRDVEIMRRPEKAHLTRGPPSEYQAQAQQATGAPPEKKLESKTAPEAMMSGLAFASAKEANKAETKAKEPATRPDAPTKKAAVDKKADAVAAGEAATDALAKIEASEEQVVKSAHQLRELLDGFSGGNTAMEAKTLDALKKHLRMQRHHAMLIREFGPELFHKMDQLRVALVQSPAKYKAFGDAMLILAQNESPEFQKAYTDLANSAYRFEAEMKKRLQTHDQNAAKAKMLFDFAKRSVKLLDQMDVYISLVPSPQRQAEIDRVMSAAERHMAAVRQSMSFLREFGDRQVGGTPSAAPDVSPIPPVPPVPVPQGPASPAPKGVGFLPQIQRIGEITYVYDRALAIISVGENNAVKAGDHVLIKGQSLRILDTIGQSCAVRVSGLDVAVGDAAVVVNQ
jgi:hypothetical protein